ncbi:MAG: MBL fold metallo-hydrolase [Kofleriaceae bacterium]|nr:MBL fold metallo-hydrolase [Kofleriaceae bacterium]
MTARAPRFHVWGCRGGRNALGSRIGNHTSCYALHAGEDLFVFDAGRGLHALAEAVLRDPTLQDIRRVHILVTHAHMDHWEGLKDAAWMWPPRNRLEVALLGPAEALAAIRQAHAPPSFVELDVLASIALQKFAYVELVEGASLPLPGATLRGVALHHYSGMTPHRHYVDTLGYHLTVDSGPRIAYLSDHEPTDQTRALEDELAATSDLTILDANYANLADHAFGHGSVEYAAALARRHPTLWVLASHHGPMRTDEAILAAHARHGADTPNLTIAIEGTGGRWDAAARQFVRD